MTPAIRVPEAVGAADRTLQADEALLLRAEDMAAASALSAFPKPLFGRNLAILCRNADCGEAVLFSRAAEELGARVACISVTLTDASSLTMIRETARVLARLYDGVECLDMSPLLVELLQESAHIPFFLGLSSESHRSASLVQRLGSPAGSHPNARKLILQASLAQALAA